MSWKLNSKTSKIVALFICAIILTASITTYVTRAVTTAPSTLTISSGVYPGAPTYTIWGENGVYYSKNANGLTTESSANVSMVFNLAIQAISEPGTIALGSDIIIKETIIIDKDNITINGNNHYISKEANSNCDMFYITGNYTSILFLGMRGNRATQTLGNGLNLSMVYLAHIENCDIRYFKDDAIHIVGNGLFGNHFIVNNKIVDCDGYGLYLYETTDEFILGNDVGGFGKEAIEIVSGGTTLIGTNHIYMAGWNGTGYNITTGGVGIHVYDGARVTINDNTVQANGLDGIRIDYSSNCTLANNFVNINNYGLGGYPVSNGIKIAYTNYTTITGGSSGNFEQSSGLFRQEYGILIDANSIYNVVVGVICIGNNIVGILNLGGATNQIHSCYNQTGAAAPDWIT